MMPTPSASPAPSARPSDARPVTAMLVGAPKAGTTSLYRYAAQHPDIAAHEQRECSYFFSDDEYQQGYDACLSKYLPGQTKPTAAFLAKHVFTMYRDEAIDRLKQHNPGVHVFALLRNPVQRAYSSYWYARRRGWDPSPSFDRAIEWELNRAGDRADWLADRDRMHLRVGVYHPHIKNLHDAFGKDRVYAFLTDELSQNAAGLCGTIFQAMGVDPRFPPDLSREHNPAAAARSQAVARGVAGLLKSRGPIKRTIRRLIPHGLARRARHAVLGINEKPFTPPPMPDDTRRRLADYFAPHNEALGQLIGRDLSTWSDA